MCIYSSLAKVYLVPPQLTTLGEAVFAGKAIIPDPRPSIKKQSSWDGWSERFMLPREETGTLTRHSWLRE